MKEKGITLVALVVTIIVLIILAGVSINLVLGTEGIITVAKRAKENMEYAQIEEQRKLNELYIQIEENDVEVGGEIEKLNDFKKAIADYIEEAGGIKPDYMADTLTFGEKIKGEKPIGQVVLRTTDEVALEVKLQVVGEVKGKATIESIEAIDKEKVEEIEDESNRTKFTDV